MIQVMDRYVGSRPYEGLDDLVHMQDLLMEGRRQTNDWYYPHVGDLNFWFFMVDCHLDPLQYIRLWHNQTGDLVAYAMLGEDPTLDWQVLPEYEWCGIEAEVLAWAGVRLDELVKQDVDAWGGPLITGARQDNIKRVAFLEEHGFRRREYAEVNMICPLEGEIAVPAVPPGWQVRSMGAEGEVRERAAVQHDVWQPWTVGNVYAEDYTRFMQLPGYDRDLDIVAVAEDGTIGAYVNGWIDPINRVGDLGPVGARQEFRRRGLSRAVLQECLRRMQVRGMERVSVSTGVSNEPALRLYASVGFKGENTYLEYARNG